ncbi:MAG: hypothetical protein LBE91_08160 [Tannerella sp.]|jgi:hypothetical protein|nr:hypothetical protein [Tannerella sp.]
MKQIKRNLSGVYFPYPHKKTGKTKYCCFEELPYMEQFKVLSDRSIEWKYALARKLAQTFFELTIYEFSHKDLNLFIEVMADALKKTGNLLNLESKAFDCQDLSNIKHKFSQSTNS